MNKKEGTQNGTKSCVVWSWLTTMCALPITLIDIKIVMQHVWEFTLTARFMGPTWGLPGTDRTQVGPRWATRTLLFRYSCSSEAVMKERRVHLGHFQTWMYEYNTDLKMLFPMMYGTLAMHLHNEIWNCPKLNQRGVFIISTCYKPWNISLHRDFKDLLKKTFVKTHTTNVS